MRAPVLSHAFKQHSVFLAVARARSLLAACSYCTPYLGTVPVQDHCIRTSILAAKAGGDAGALWDTLLEGVVQVGGLGHRG